MPPPPFDCPSCGYHFFLQHAKPGTRLNCPRCRTAVSVPESPPGDVVAGIRVLPPPETPKDKVVSAEWRNFRCPRCEKTITIDSPLPGERIQCDSCGATFVAHAPKPDKPAKKSSKATKSKKRKPSRDDDNECPECGEPGRPQIVSRMNTFGRFWFWGWLTPPVLLLFLAVVPKGDQNANAIAGSALLCMAIGSFIVLTPVAAFGHTFRSEHGVCPHCGHTLW